MKVGWPCYKKEEGNYTSGKRDSVWTSWYESGNKKKKGNYKDGKKEGLWISWYDNGVKKQVGTYKDDRPDGILTSWYDNGKKYREGMYKYGVPFGFFTFWYKNGQKREEGINEGGRLIGKWTYWSPDGKDSSELIHKDGVPWDGIFTSWYENGQKRKERRMTKEELQLIEQVKKGDISAFRKIMETHQEKIYYLTYDMTGNRQDAEDLSQEVFIKAYHSIKKFRGDAKLSSWLYRVAVNTCIDKKRKKKEIPVNISDDQSEDRNDSLQYSDKDPNSNPEYLAESELMQKNIKNALQRLSPRERSVFVLRHYNDLQISEIANILNLSIGTVKSLIFRAIQKLKDELSFYRKDFGLEESR